MTLQPANSSNEITISNTSPKYEYKIVGNKSHVDIYKQHNAEKLCEKNRTCMLLAEAGYYEGRGEPDDGVLAIMQTALNRVNHPRWPDDLREVLYHRCQFSYTCDGSLRGPKKELLQWERMKRLAYLLKNGYASSPVQDATHYHATRVSPYWRKSFKKLASIGNHIFYLCERNC